MLSAVGICGSAWNCQEKMRSERFSSDVNIPAGFTSEVLATGVVKISNDDALVYLKPISEFFRESIHRCSAGRSGYQIRHIREVQMGDHVVYSGELIRSGGKL